MKNHNRLSMKCIALISLIIISANFSFSQETKVKKYGYGFYFEGNRTFLNVNTNNTVLVKPTFGGGLGIMADYDLSNHLNLSTKIGLSFSNSTVSLVYNEAEIQEYKVYPQNLDFRLQANYLIGKKHNRPYVFVGPSVMIPLVDRTKPTWFYENANTNASIDFGIGFDKDFDILHFLPEIRYSHGLINVNATPILRSQYVHRLTLTLIFKD